MHGGAELYAVIVVGLLLTAALSFLAARKMRFPFTILLVIIGVGLGAAARNVHALHPLSAFKLTPDVVLFVLLPVLIFESAFNLDARRLLKNAGPIGALAVPALLISTAAVGAGLYQFTGMALPVALLFGALISATDPVAVVALFKEMGAPKRLALLVEGESLLNDGTALVVFKILLGIAAAGAFSAGALAEGALSFFIVAAGGLAVGTVFGVVFAKAIERIDNEPLVEITLTTVLAHSSFISAEAVFHVSGVMATVAAGLTMGSYGRTKISPPVLAHMESFWEYLSFVCNSLVFLLVGLSIDPASLWQSLGTIGTAFLIVAGARIISVAATVPIVNRLQADKVTRPEQAVIIWGGLRGALAIVMALSLPEDFPGRDGILNLTFGVVLLSLLINGLTIGKLMALLGLDRYSRAESIERAAAIVEVRRKTAESLASEFTGGQQSASRALGVYADETDTLERELAAIRTGAGAEDETRVVLTHAVNLERNLYRELYARGAIGEDNLKDMLLGIERQIDRLKEGRALYAPGKPPLLERIDTALEHAHLFKPLTLRYKARRLAAHYEIERARVEVSRRVLDALEEEGRFHAVSESALGAARAVYTKLNAKARERLIEIRSSYPEYVERAEEAILTRLRLSAEMSEYAELHEHGALSDKAYAELREENARAVRRVRRRPVRELEIPPRELMSRVPLFNALDAGHLAMLVAAAEAVSFLAGETIVTEGETGDSLYIVGRGSVDVTRREPDGAAHPLAHLGAGEFFGEIALLHPQPRTATVRAATPCTLIVLTKPALMPVLSEVPALKETLEAAYRARTSHTA